ncbi:MAG TPA: GNAT family N-acetyltransferase [Candidatus Limnocylindrales bacterium]|nr:GNAT family N-acetyltransferase [Candidatus Limnocylindrales bacterium]
MTAADIDPAVIEMFDRNMIEFYVQSRSRPWADIKIDDDVIWGSTGLPLQAFNGAIGATFSEANADARIETVLDYFRELKLDMSWWVGPSSPAWLGDRLVAHGLKPDGVAPGMAMSLEGWSAPPAPDGLDIEQTLDAASFHDAIEVMFEGFEMPSDAQPLFEERFRDYSVGSRAVQRTYVARVDGRPVATSLGYTLDGIVTIYNVATVPEARRRGFGAAVTAAAMADAQTAGATWAILETSDIGRSVYERLGFRHVADIAIYAGDFSGTGTGTE